MKTDTQAVILAAGKGTRMLPLTQTKPKPMQEVLGKNLIEWKLEVLPPEVKDIIIVIGYQGEQIRDFFGTEWKGRRIQYAVQEELNGTAGALWTARSLLSDPSQQFLVMMGDDLYGKEDFAAMLRHEFAIAGVEARQREIGGEIQRGQDGTFTGIIEPRHYVESGFINTGLYMLDRRIFDYEPAPIGGSSTEFGLPHTLLLLARDFPVAVVGATKWLQVTTPEDLHHAEKFVSSLTNT